MLTRLLLIALLLPAWAWAEAPITAEGETSPAVAETSAPLGEADQEALRTLLSEATAALNNLDAKAVGSYLAPGFVITLADQSVITSSAELDAYFTRTFHAEGAPIKGIHFSLQPSEQALFIDNRSGMVYGTSTERYTLADDSTLVLNTHWTATVVKEQGRWLVQGFHAGVNMLDNPILSEVRMGNSTWGGIGMAIGFIAGVFLSRALRRG